MRNIKRGAEMLNMKIERRFVKMRNFGRKGLSDIITTVLIILLVLAAVVIIWQFVKPAINSVEEIGAADCIKADVSVVSCVNDSTGRYPLVTYKVNGLQGVTLEGVKVVVTQDDGSTVSANGAKADLYNSANANVTTMVSPRKAASASVAPVIKGQTKTFTCQTLSTPVTCN